MSCKFTTMYLLFSLAMAEHFIKKTKTGGSGEEEDSKRKKTINCNTRLFLNNHSPCY
uniref:Uncharacterized protein n=1 Tax=Nelumbo nucifera TaxID=4432 RepID=A0A822Y0P8_NELNU|nr:TPA_asm: hypothetical protein HUJ06_028952 [Nelumbo nucifera]